jgi:DNA topoisomerase-6 subunit B
MRAVPVSAPRKDCLVPIGAQRLEEGLRKEINAKFYTVLSRPPAVYRGNPFQVEIGIAYGRAGTGGAGTLVAERERTAKRRVGNEQQPSAPRADEPAQLMRFANRVPLLYEQAGCAITRAVVQTNWHTYGLQQTKGALPIAPMIVLVHVASVWVPFTSEAKEAIASYPEIVRELKLGLQECGRRLSAYLRGEARLRQERERREHIQRYLPHIGVALQEMLSMSDDERDAIVADLDAVIRSKRKEP